jgi:hypothetical protein
MSPTESHDRHHDAAPVIFNGESSKEHQENDEEVFVTTATRTTWPEEANDTTPWYILMYRRWTFSYMNQILDQGSRQKRPDGTHLAMEDLYPVPPSMKSKLLTRQFLYVCIYCVCCIHCHVLSWFLMTV